MAKVCFESKPSHLMRLVELTGGRLKMGVPRMSLVRAIRRLRKISQRHFTSIPEEVDGICYSSQPNEERNIALYDQALPKVRAEQTPRFHDLRDPVGRDHQ